MLIVLFSFKYLTQRETVEAQARQSHATTKPAHAEDGK